MPRVTRGYSVFSNIDREMQMAKQSEPKKYPSWQNKTRGGGLEYEKGRGARRLA